MSNLHDWWRYNISQHANDQKVPHTIKYFGLMKTHGYVKGYFTKILAWYVSYFVSSVSILFEAEDLKTVNLILMNFDSR
jgi:hypothetical protein